MKIFRTAIIVAAIVGLASIAWAQPDARVSKTWEVQKYDINVTLPTAEADRSISSRAILSLRNVSSAPASSLTLRISSLAEVSSVKVGANQTDFSKSEEKVGSGSLQRISLRALSVPAGGTTSVDVAYRLRVDENSGLAALTPAYAQFLPLSFWYPTPNSWYFPRGADYAPYQIQITTPTGATVVSAGAMTAGVFDQPIYGQPFFVVGNYDPVSNRNVLVSLAKGAGADERKRADDLAAFAADAKAYFETLFGTSPNVPLRLISVRRGAGYADAGTILLDETAFRRQKLDSLTAMSIAESVARIWLGAATPIAGDGGGAIREGLVRYVATEFLESKFGREIADVERMRQRTAYVAVSKRDAPMSQLTPLDDYYYVTNANKGAMIWRLIARKVGTDAFFGVLKANMRTGGLTLSGLRGAFGQHKEIIDYSFDQVTDLDLMIGLPQAVGGETRMALRNTGSIDVEVDVTATNEKGERSRNTVTIPARGFTDTVFRNASKIVRVEVDADKLYPQLDYANDVKPAAVDESDAVLFIKRQFDRQDFPAAERNARIVIAGFPRFDDARILLARSLLAQGKTSEAEREFRSAMDEKLPSARTLAWGNVGLGEVALKNGQAAQSMPFFDAAVRTGAEAGAVFAARQGRVKANIAPVIDEAVKAYFAAFDKAAISGNKPAFDALIVAGDTPKAFGGGIVGQAQEWTSRVTYVDVIDAQNVFVEANLSIRVINKAAESGTAVFRLTKLASGWKLSGVESFEVR